METKEISTSTIERTDALRTVLTTFIEFHCGAVKDGMPAAVAYHLVVELTKVFQEFSKHWGYTEDEMTKITHEVMVEHGSKHHGMSPDQAVEAADTTTEVLLAPPAISHLN